MNWIQFKHIRCVAAIFMVALMSACTQPEPPETDTIITAGPVTVNAGMFARELELKMTAYPYDIKTHPGEYNAMVTDLVSTLSDETVFLAAALYYGIDVTDQELETAEQDFKKDYPEDSFDTMLIENAIEYPVWKKRFKQDMVIEKLIRQRLVDVQDITPEDMVAFCSRMDKQGGRDASLDENGLIRQLRLEKSIAAYDEWVRDLKEKFPPQINKKVLAAFLINSKKQGMNNG